MQFFKIVDGNIELARPEIALIPTVNEILKRDKGGKVTGDPDGRKKLYAFRELAYVYFRCDFYAYPIQHSLSESAAHSWAVRNALLPDHYEPDAIVRDLMVQYINEHLSPAKQTIKNLLDTFSLNDIAIKNATANLKLLLDNSNMTITQISDLIKIQQLLLSIATDIPHQVKVLREAMSIVQEEEKQILIKRGGDEVSDSSLPGNDIENY